MLFSIGLQQLIFFEFGIDRSGLLFLFDLLKLDVFVLDDDTFVLPCPPNFILDFLLLLGSLLNGGNYAPLSPVYFNQLVLLHLLYYHLSPPLLPLVLLLLVLSVRQSLLLSHL